MDRRITILGAVHIAWGAIGAMSAFVIYIAIAGAGVISGDYEAERITGLVASSIFFPMFFLSLPAIVGGIGLLGRRAWARIILLAYSFINLLFIPFGTVLGLITLKYLFEKDITEQFSGPAHSERKRLEPVSGAEEH